MYNMKFFKITLLLVLTAIATGLDAQISRQCTDFTPVFTSANVTDCLLTADVADAQGQAPDQFTYVWKIDGQVVSPNVSRPDRLTYSFDEANNHTVTVIMTLRKNSRCTNSVSFNFNIDEACEDDPFVVCTCPNSSPCPCPIVVGDEDTYPCPTNNDIHFNYEGGGGICTDGSANVTGLNTEHVDRVEWSWALRGETGVGAATGTTSPIYFGSGDFTGSDIVVRAKVFYDNGQECDEVWKRFPLNCGLGLRNSDGIKSEIKLYPNPTNGFFSIKLPEDIEINKISIKQLNGVEIKEIKNFNSKVLTEELPRGSYFIEFISKDKKSYVKQLIVN